MDLEQHVDVHALSICVYKLKLAAGNIDLVPPNSIHRQETSIP